MTATQDGTRERHGFTSGGGDIRALRYGAFDTTLLMGPVA